ncbi:MAG: galactokinase [Propionibacteriales bacterium]|nr:galactokinase [Propionibacteriales bacterium]
MTSTWSAPGRVNLIGEHVDYNDGLVLPFALPLVTTARVSRRDDGRVRVSSAGVGSRQFSVATEPGDVGGWAAYVAGVVWALRRRGVDMPGLDIEVSSEVPLGAGLSSSAALTCAVASAIDDELGGRLGRVELASVARDSENTYVGAPTGVMDQLAAMLCEADRALLLDCRDLSTRSIPFDPAAAELTLLLIDTQVRHSLVDSAYGDRRADCQAAAEKLGVTSLREVTARQVVALADERLRRRAHHVVTEIARVQDVAAILDAGRPGDIGAYLSASHGSLRDEFEVSCAELDVTVEAALAGGALGARMVGGGFGGCVIALCRDCDVAAVRSRVEAAYNANRWQIPSVWAPRPSRGAYRAG